MDEKLIEKFLKDRRIDDAGERGRGLLTPNRIGRALQRVGASPVIKLMGLDSAVDQVLVTAPVEQATKLVFEALKKSTREAIDPSLFSSTATYVALLGKRDFLGNYYGTDLAFISVRQASDSNTQVLVKVFSLKMAGLSTAASSLRAVVKDINDVQISSAI